MRYYFNFRRKSGLLLDPEGAEYASLEAAHAAGWAGVREIIAERLKSGQKIGQDNVLEIADEHGNLLQDIKFWAVIQYHL